MPLWSSQTRRQTTRISNLENWSKVGAPEPLLTSGAWGADGQIVYTPIEITEPKRVSVIKLFKGATDAGYGGVGIFLPRTSLGVIPGEALALAEYAPNGSPIAPINLGIGRYFLGATFSLATQTVTRIAVGNADLLSGYGVYIETGYGILPFSAYPDLSWVAVPSVAVPLMAIY